MSDQEIGKRCDPESGELFFEDRLFLFLTAPMPKIFWKMPTWVSIILLVWYYISTIVMAYKLYVGLSAWLTAVLVIPYIYVTIFGAIPTIICSVLFILLMPWHAPPAPRAAFRSVLRQRIRRLRAAKAQRSNRRVLRGGWVREGDRLVQVDSNGLPRTTRRAFFWNAAIMSKPRVRWGSTALPNLRRKAGE